MNTPSCRDRRRALAAGVVAAAAAITACVLLWRSPDSAPAPAATVPALPSEPVASDDDAFATSAATALEAPRTDAVVPAPDLRVFLCNRERDVARGAMCIARSCGSRGDGVPIRADDGRVTFPATTRPAEYVVWHRHGVRHRGSQSASTVSRDVTLAPAGAIVVRAPWLRDVAMRVRVTPPAGGEPTAAIEASTASGEAVCEGVPAAWGTATVEVFAAGASMSPPAPVPVVAGEDRVVELAVPAAHAVRGIVVDPNHAGLAGVFVNWVPEDGVAAAQRNRSATTGENGSFVLHGVDGGRGRLSLTKLNYGSSTRALGASNGGDVDLGRLVLEPGRSVSGRIVHRGRAVGRGTPGLEHIEVGCTRAESLSGLLSERDVTMFQRTRPDAEGAFQLRGVDRGTWVVWVAPKGRAPFADWRGAMCTVADGDVRDLVLDIGEARTWACTLRADTPRVEGRVVARGILEPWAAHATLDTSRAELAVGGGPFLVGWHHGGNVRWLHVSTGSSAGETIVLPTASVSFAGVQLEHAGDLAMASTTLVYENGQFDATLLPLAALCANPPAAPAFEIGALLPGQYRLEFTSPGLGRRSTRFEVLPGQRRVLPWPFGE